MAIYCMMSRGATILAEYGLGGDEYSAEALGLLSRNSKSGSRLIALGDKFAAILNKKMEGDNYSFLAIISEKQERDQAFDLLEKICNFFEDERQSGSSKITSEITLHMSRQIRTLMERSNKKKDEETMENIHDNLDKAQNIAKNNLTNMLDNKMKLEDMEYQSSSIRDSAFAFEQGSKKLERQMRWQRIKTFLILGGIAVFTIGGIYYMIG